MIASRVLGVDPGLGGALALIEDGVTRQLVAVEDMPTEAKTFGSGRQVYVGGLVAMLRALEPSIAFIERSQPMQGRGKRQSPAGAFSMGDSFGALRAVTEALAIPTIFVPANTWKTAMGLMGKRKSAEAPVTMARQVYPSAEPYLRRKMDHDRAEAILIAQWGIVHHLATEANRRAKCK